MNGPPIRSTLDKRRSLVTCVPFSSSPWSWEADLLGGSRSLGVRGFSSYGGGESNGFPTFSSLSRSRSFLRSLRSRRSRLSRRALRSSRLSLRSFLLRSSS